MNAREPCTHSRRILIFVFNPWLFRKEPVQNKAIRLRGIGSR